MQQRVEKHFDALTRSRGGSNYPIFALEHGLNETDLERIRSMLRSRLSERTLSSRYWLLWVIYATELGYDYAGDEYWGSFEKKTPGWEHQDRTKIKAWFRKFQNIYDGVTPIRSLGRALQHHRLAYYPRDPSTLPPAPVRQTSLRPSF